MALLTAYLSSWSNSIQLAYTVGYDSARPVTASPIGSTIGRSYASRLSIIAPPVGSHRMNASTINIVRVTSMSGPAERRLGHSTNVVVFQQHIYGTKPSPMILILKPCPESAEPGVPYRITNVRPGFFLRLLENDKTTVARPPFPGLIDPRQSVRVTRSFNSTCQWTHNILVNPRVIR